MDTNANKDMLKQVVKDWIMIDRDISMLKQELKAKETQKKTHTARILSLMETNNVGVFNFGNSKLVHKTTHVKKPINKKSLIKILEDFYKSDTQSALQLTEFILNARETTTYEKIEHKLIEE